MSKNICNKKPSSGKVETGFVNYSKSLVKTFVIMTVVFLILGLNNFISTSNTDSPLFSSAIFIIGITILFSIVNVIDQYMYNNIILGLGLAIGLSLMGIQNIGGANVGSQSIASATV